MWSLCQSTAVEDVASDLQNDIGRTIAANNQIRQQCDDAAHVTFVSDCGLDTSLNVIRCATDSTPIDVTLYHELERRSREAQPQKGGGKDYRLDYNQRIGTIGAWRAASMLDAKKVPLLLEESIGLDADVFGSAQNAHLIDVMCSARFLACDVDGSELRRFSRPEAGGVPKPKRRFVEANICTDLCITLDKGKDELLIDCQRRKDKSVHTFVCDVKNDCDCEFSAFHLTTVLCTAGVGKTRERACAVSTATERRLSGCRCDR